MATPNNSPQKTAIGSQVVALVLAGAAVIWGCCMVYVALYPGASGEWGAFSVLFAAMVDIPVGLASLVVGLAVKKGLPALRRTCIVLSVAALALPFLTKAAWQSHYRIKPSIRTWLSSNRFSVQTWKLPNTCGPQ